MLVSDTPEILEYHIGKSAARKNGLHDSDAVIVKTDKFGRPVSFVFDGCAPAFDATIFIDSWARYGCECDDKRAEWMVTAQGGAYVLRCGVAQNGSEMWTAAIC